MDFKFYLSLLVRRLPLILLLTFLGAAIGGTLAVVLPPTYSAQARLVAEAEQIPSDLAASTVQVDPREQLQIIEQRIMARDVLIEMSNRLGVFAAEAARGERLSADEKVTRLRERITMEVSGSSGRGQSDATLVTVGFRSPDPDLAAAVTNDLVTLLLNENVAMRQRTASETLEFFIQEVDRLNTELQIRSASLQSFQEANRDSLPESLEFRRSQLMDAQARLLQMSRDEAMLKDRREQLVQLYEQTGGVGLAVDGAAMTPEERELSNLQSQLAGMLAIMSPTNPRVVALKGQIAAMEQRVIAARGDAATAAGTVGLSAYEVQLADIDTQLTYLQEQRTTLEETAATLNESISATPANGLSLDELQRDYANVRAQYDAAVARRAAAETGEMIESLNRGQRISLIESATTPRSPESPNRPLLAGMGVGVGLLAGLVLAAGLEMMNRAIRRPVDLTTGLGIKAFAALPLIRNRADVRRRRLKIASAFAVALIGIPALMYAFHTFLMPLDQAIGLVVARLS